MVRRRAAQAGRKHRADALRRRLAYAAIPTRLQPLVYRINTAITQGGSTVPTGFWVDKRDRQTRKVRWEHLDEVLAYLSEHYYDLHYAPVPQARHFSFGLGNLWRIATEWPGNPVPPCVHRAPETLPHQPPRLLLIS